MRKKILSLLLAGVMVLGSGCSNKAGTNPEQPAQGSYEVWSTYNTMRVVQDPALNGNYDKQEMQITAEMAKNELETAQLFITTDENMEVEYFMLYTEDLVNEEGDVFPANQVDVYVQHYVDITEHSYLTDIEEYPLGFMPDGLIPMDLSDRYGENVIAKNCNQGLTIDFTAKKSTPAGTYTGEFVLEINDDELIVPVELVVWDFALPEQSTCISSVMLYDEEIMYGEMTTNQSEIDNLYKNYYDVLLRNKLNATWVPYALVSPSALVASVVEYWDHPNFATYGMPHYTFIGEAQNGWTKGWYEYYKEAMIGLAKASTMDAILFDKMFFFNVDEPSSGVWGTMEELDYFVKAVVDLKNDVEEELISSGFFNNKSAEFKERLLKSLHDVEHLCTVSYSEERAEANGDLTYCPIFGEFNGYYQQLSILKDAEKNNNKMWYYTTIGPQSPYPTQFVDDFMITGREMKWMQKYYNLSGWHYYEGNAASILNAKSVLSQNINPYETAYRWENGNISNGDGYLVLPGARYEQTSPIQTQRLVVYREGQDDLDMMNYLDSIYADYNSFYGLEDGTISFNTVHDDLFDRMFCRGMSYRSDEVLKENRQIIANTIMNALTLEDMFAKTITYSGNYATYNFYLANGFTVKVNGNELQGVASGSGKVFTYKVDLRTEKLLSSIEIVSGSSSRTVKFYENTDVKAINVVGEGAITATVTEQSNVTATENGLIFDIKSVEKGSLISTMRFVPKVKVDFAYDFKTIELDLENTKDSTVMMKLVLVGNNGSTYSTDISLTANTKWTVEVLNRLADGVKVKSFEITFENGKLEGDTVNLIADRQVILSGIRIK